MGKKGQYRLRSERVVVPKSCDGGGHPPATAGGSDKASTIRSAVYPSQYSGMRSFDLSGGLSSARFAAVTIFVVSVPAIVFVPISTVIGRSVFSLSVMQGMPNTVVSS